MEDSLAQPRTARSRVMIVDDQTAIRQMLATFVRWLPEFTVVAESGDLTGALRLAEETRPDVIVLDWMFPGGGGLPFLRGLKAASLQPRVLVFSAAAHEHAVHAALTNGARGFIEKDASFDEVVAALRAVAAGRIYFGPAVARIVEQLTKSTAEGTEPGTLSPRECEVLRLLGEGRSSKEIAARLGLSVLTVNNHRANISGKTGLHSVAQLTMHAARLGLIPGPGEFAAAS